MKTFNLLPLPSFDFIQQIDGSAGVHNEFYLGGNTVFIKHKYLKKYCPEIADLYSHRKNVALKIRNIRAGSIKITQEQFIEQTKIQNLFAMYGLAPRVYDVCYINYGDAADFQAQIIEEVQGDVCHDMVTMNLFFELLQFIADKFGIELTVDGYRSNVRDKQLVDFDFAKFKNKKEYEKRLVKNLIEFAVTKTGGGSYQAFPELGITNGRKADTRIIPFGLDKIDLSGKTILEIGCSGGTILNYLCNANLYAKYFVGIDLPEVIGSVREAANYLGNFRTDFFGFDLKKDGFNERIQELTGFKSFDIVLMFSMNHHIGFHQWMADLTKKELYVECNGAYPLEEEKLKYTEEFLKMGFKSVEEFGYTEDGPKRALLKFTK